MGDDENVLGGIYPVSRVENDLGSDLQDWIRM